MNISRIRSAVVYAAVSLASLTACAQQTNYDEVGKQMSILLQNNHFARLPFMEMGPRFLDDFLRDLDSSRVFFTQGDVDRFRKEYGENLPVMLLEEDSMRAAQDIYAVYKERVKARVAEAKRLLGEEKAFDFTKEETVQRSRKEAPWPKDETEAMDLWRRQIKEALLAENLRQEMVAKLAKEQGKPNPLEKEKKPAEKILIRYERFLRSVTQDFDDDDLGAAFLTAVAQAHDPHTDYLSAKEMDRFKDSMRNELVGIGALLQAHEDGATQIKGIVLGGPADKQGKLRLNDRVVAVDPDGEKGPREMVDIMFMTIDKVVDLIRGEQGSEVLLKVEPAAGAAGSTELIEIVREKVELKDEQAKAELIEVKNEKGEPRRLGVIVLPSFYADFDEGTTRCSVDVEVLLQRLKKEKIDGLLLDLRNNGGGSLEEVKRMTGFFTKRGPVVQVKDTLGRKQVKESENKTPIYEGPMVVLTDKSSASASEILAGALQDYHRAVVVGESSTFGKGTVQQPMYIDRWLPLLSSNNKAGTLKVTIQKFYRPSGSSTQMDGVVPDVVLPSLVDALEVGEKYLDHALGHDVIGPAPNFKKLDKANLYLGRLQELSAERVNVSKDFTYIREDIAKTKARIQQNQVSLNLEERRKEINEMDALQHQRNAERKKRFAEVQSTDQKAMAFYELTLDEVEKESALRQIDPTKEAESNMKRAKDETEALDETPRWPSGLDPFKREGLMVLKDLVNLTKDAQMAGVHKIEK